MRKRFQFDSSKLEKERGGSHFGKDIWSDYSETGQGRRRVYIGLLSAYELKKW